MTLEKYRLDAGPDMETELQLMSPDEVGQWVDWCIAEQFERVSDELGQPADRLKTELLDRTCELSLRERGGLRGYLAYLTYRGAGGKNDRVGAHLSTAQELYETRLLVLDDVMDKDLERRGGPNMTGMYLERFRQTTDPMHRAESVAILSAELLDIYVRDQIRAMDVSLEVRSNLFDRMDEAGKRVGPGQHLDLALGTEPEGAITKERVMDGYSGKTAEYTAVLPLVLGATAAEAPPQLIADLREAGYGIGVAYQIYDDLRGAFGSPAETGKPVGSDLREGRRTLQVQIALMRLSGHDPYVHRELTTMLRNGSATESEQERFQDILRDSGAVSVVGDIAKGYIAESRRKIKALDLHPTAIGGILNITRLVQQRVDGIVAHAKGSPDANSQQE